MENYIRTQYNNFKEYMRESELPDIKPVFDMKQDNIGSLAYVDSEYIKQDVVSIYINEQLFKYNERYYKSILFHEFTHVFDANITFKNFNMKDLEELLSSYSEYHASQIEIMANIGFGEINKKENFDKNIQLYRKDKIMNIIEYLSYPLNDAVNILDNFRLKYMNLSDKDYAKKYVIAKKSILYYLGKYSICEQYCKQNIQNSFSDFAKFESDVESMYLALKKKNYKEIQNTTNSFMNHFFSYFVSYN